MTLFDKYIFIQELESNKLHIFEQGSKEKVRVYEGKPYSDKEEPAFNLRVKQTQEKQESFLWYSGGADVTLLDISANFSQTKIDGFLNVEGETTRLSMVCSLMMTRPKKALALCVNSNQEYFIKAYDIAKKKDRLFPTSQITDEKNSKTIDSIVTGFIIEETSRTNVFYLASKNKVGIADKAKTQLQICALKMASAGLEIQDYFTFDPVKHADFKSIGAMRSYPAPNKQEFLLVAGEGSIILLKVTKNISFVEFHIFKGLNAGLITDIDLQGLVLLSCSPSDKMVTSLILPNNFTTSKQIAAVIDPTNFNTKPIELMPGGRKLI